MALRSLDTEVQFLKGVGPRLAVGMQKAGLHTVRDVLYHIPRRYEDRRNIPPISKVRAGQFVTVRGRITHFEGRPARRGGMVVLKAMVSDKTGNIALTWFNQPWIRRALERYEGEIVAYGMAKDARWGCEINSPEWEKIDEDSDPDDFARIVPVYPLTEGLSQVTVRRAARSAVAQYLEFIEEPLPSLMLRENKLRDLRWCLRQIHEPTSEEERVEARRRLVFEEFLYLQVALAMRRAETHQELGISFPISSLIEAGRSVGRSAPTPAAIAAGPPQTPPAVSSADRPPSDLRSTSPASGGRTGGGGVEHASANWSPDGSHVGEIKPVTLFEEMHREARREEPLWDQIHRMLPFELTGAQRRVIHEIFADMESPHPMNRLVQGDVGSGKTAVAACAMLAAVRCGYQAALMAPTEILAEQHHANLAHLFEPLGIEVALLVGKQTPTEKKKAAQRTASGEIHMAVGTHALIQEGVGFAKLGFVVIDEQHRFGVMQRAALRDKGVGNPDVLVMTATPIPRTLTMTLYGDLDLSVIDELPPGRKPVKTHHKPPSERRSVYQAVTELLEQGRQAYFVCPMVSESEKMQAQAAEDLYYRLQSELFGKRIALLHGQMKSRDKEEVMEAFRRHEYDVLVSTTVIEVGVDVPNASVMVVEDANRFGLSQLHQLRGRVGRGAHQSFCILISDAKSEDAKARTEIMVQTSDGFRIAEEDLRLRGPGELAGTKQSGNLDFKIADLVQDGKMLEVARQAAIKVVEADPQLAKPENRGILGRVRERRSAMAVVTVS